MKRLLFAAILLLGLSMIFSSCSANDNYNIDGYWVGRNTDTNSYEYLYCEGGKAYVLDSWRVPNQYKQKQANYDEAKVLFQSKDTSKFTFKINYAIEVYLPDDVVIKQINRNDKEFSVSEEFKSFLNSAGPSSQKYEYLATRFEEIDFSTVLIYDKENRVPKISTYQGEGEEYSAVVSFVKIEPTITKKEANNKKENKGRNTINGKNAWVSVFDENGLAAFDTGLGRTRRSGQQLRLFIFLYAYSYSDDYTEGTASISYYPIIDGESILMNCEYKYKDGVVYLKRGVFEHNFNWLPLRIHEMPLVYNNSSKRLSGTLWIDNIHNYSIDAALENVNFSSGKWRNDIF